MSKASIRALDWTISIISYLFNPNGGSYTAVSIGNWYVSKQIDKLFIKGGYI
ncbi:MAG: hypothetical protein IPL13_17455 [Saprospiraceae bacterium]|nr:hypothetical protein [Candidatus Brachybacter algidus]